ncbi:hypothetical protein KIPB_003360 [Kipferlia bialata]|uniref:Uncharacterized protein n=1 Tax=Kipferlia bialata TaxID=797122 RepID=A0A9K3GGL9_9EUKA|nr:hypothetical protein KIPB_003360 [Kipferlia bialata]|eukprot:g3360.t1
MPGSQLSRRGTSQLRVKVTERPMSDLPRLQRTGFSYRTYSPGYGSSSDTMWAKCWTQSSYKSEFDHTQSVRPATSSVALRADRDHKKVTSPSRAASDLVERPMTTGPTGRLPVQIRRVPQYDTRTEQRTRFTAPSRKFREFQSSARLDARARWMADRTGSTDSVGGLGNRDDYGESVYQTTTRTVKELLTAHRERSSVDVRPSSAYSVSDMGSREGRRGRHTEADTPTPINSGRRPSFSARSARSASTGGSRRTQRERVVMQH